MGFADAGERIQFSGLEMLERLPDGGRRFKHDPLHTTPGPFPFRVATAIQFWRRITCPVLLVDGADSDFRFSSDDTARREAALHGFDKVVIAVPTSIGYGTNFGGLAALLGMLNSCGSGVTVCNIDNGFGGGYAAAQINRLAAGLHPSQPS